MQDLPAVLTNDFIIIPPRKHLINMYTNKLLVLLILIGFFTSVSGQSKCPVKKIYAYKQASLPGIQPPTVENGGKERTETFNYWIYLTLPSTKNIEVNHIWISGNKFSVKVESVETTPVIKTNSMSGAGNESTKLVPETKHKVILLYPTGLLSNEKEGLSKKIITKIESNELVIEFTRKGKKRLARKSQIRVLSPEPLP